MTKPGMFSASRNRFILAVCSIGLALTGCGGGGGGGSSPPVTVNLDASVPVQMLEGADAGVALLEFTVRLSDAAEGALSINYSTADLDATGLASCNDAGADFVASAGTLTIPSGQTSGIIQVQVCGDDAFEANEKLTLTLTSTSAKGVLGNQPSLTGLIVNDDAGGLNDTGVSACGAGVLALAGCPQAAYPAQDAQHGRDANSLTNSDTDGSKGFSFTKLDSDGNALASNAATWACVRDNVTGKLWEAKTAGNQTATYTWAAAQAYATGIGSLCGVSGWRLPTPRELTGLLDNSLVGGVSAAVESDFFPDQQRATYWSVSPSVGSPTEAWAVSFQYGIVLLNGQNLVNHVRLVHGTDAAPSYQAAIAGTVRDPATGLHWRQCVDGMSVSGATCTGTAQTYTWQAALDRVTAVNQAGFAGYTDWRLPNRNELASIVDFSNDSPALDTTAFPGFPQVGGVTPNFWSSTPYAGNGAQAWSIGFEDGDVAPLDQSNAFFILLVRGGQ
jgi:hypothetical protein